VNPRSAGGARSEVERLLRAPDCEKALEAISALPARGVIRVLLASICSTEQALRWRAIRAMGRVVVELADEDMKAARTVMRRLMWSLNDESGGIGWGAPEAMGEIMANHRGLADEFAHVLISYLDPCGNYLDYAPLRRGALWGVKRLCEADPARMEGARPFLEVLQASADAEVRELTRSALQALKA